MPNEIKFRTKHVYGNALKYPACARGVEFLKALNLKTFTPEAITAIKALGFTMLEVL